MASTGEKTGEKVKTEEEPGKKSEGEKTTPKVEAAPEGEKAEKHQGEGGGEPTSKGC